MGASGYDHARDEALCLRLLKVRFKQFRRFFGEQALELNEDLVALVGPNEAGKSSILAAIENLGLRKHPAPSDVTRNAGGPASVSGLYVLEDSDREAIAGIHDASQVTHAWVEYRSDSTTTYWTLVARPKRDLAPRTAALKLLDRLNDDPELDQQFSTDPNLPWDDELLAQARDILASEAESLGAQELQSLVGLADRLERLEADNDEDEEKQAEALEKKGRRATRHEVASQLKKLAEHEGSEEPSKQITAALSPRLPGVAVFRDADRELESSYNFDEVVGDTPPALLHLWTVAGLDLDAVQAARTAGRTGTVERLFEEANLHLKERYLDTWNQSNVYPHFGPPHEGVLHVWIATEGEASYSEPSERSDGLRWFIALHAFLMALGDERPILLVDEAETHLHYDAQADLIDALMRQQRTAKVVYSTHSVGCLPPDLGRGIRAVLAERDAERSKIENSYWAIKVEGQDHVGYTPLLFAMGAQLLALTVPRFAVITEGSSDAVLLPTLLREASDTDQLDYRVVPGLVDIEKERMSSVGTHAGKVVCLSDGDAAGRKRLEQIERTGFDKACLFHLGQVLPDCTLEDLVAPGIFAAAVKLEIDAWGIEGLDVPIGSVPKTGRWTWLKSLANDPDGKPIADRLNKTRVAQRIVDMKQQSDPGTVPTLLIEPSLRHAVSDLHGQITKTLNS
jgi:predicted ATP-binding protein involved in virulence